MKTILYRIPNFYFPGVFVKKPFHAKVNYEMKDGVVRIYDICVSPLCLTHIDNTAAMVTEMNKVITEAERKAAMVNNINPTIAAAIAPHI
jgi:hypothetical protein